MEFESLEKFISISGSLIALSTTLYFWLVRSNSERPNLSLSVLKPLTGSVIHPFDDSYPFHFLQGYQDGNWVRYFLDMALVNNSTLPNAVLGFSGEILGKDGEWIPVHCRAQDESLLPASLSPMSTTGIKLVLYIPTTESGGNNQQRVEIANQILNSDQKIRLQIHALGESVFEFTESARPTLQSAYQKVPESTNQAKAA